jgi:hypothetical protein
MRRNDQPSRPNAMTCYRFSLLKTWLMTTEANFPLQYSALSLLSMAVFHLIIYGRFWVITEVNRTFLSRMQDLLGLNISARLTL